MYKVLKEILFYSLLSTLIHCAACVSNDILDCNFDRKVGTFLSAVLTVNDLLTLFNVK